MILSFKHRALLLVPALLGLMALSGGLIGLQSVRQIVLATPEPVVEQPRSVTVVASNGALLRPFTTSGGYWRIPVELKDVDPRLLTFLLAYEDQRFYEHNGIDKRAMARAAGQLILNGQIVSGASTLTMQVVRLLSDKSTRHAAGKIQQIVQAQKLERRFSKQEILELYLNHAPYGGNLEGVRAASWAYFGKEPKWLNLAEIALLIALPQAPESRRPDRFYDQAFKARARVLDRLANAGLVTPADADRAANAPLPSERRHFPMLAPHVAQELKAVAKGNQMVKTTIDYNLQTSLESHVTQRSAGLGKGFSIAVMVVDHETGDIRASIGGPGLLSGNSAAHMNMIRAVRSPGSTLKPLIYGLGFEAGFAHPNTMIDDRPSAFADYVPENFDTGFHGSMTISEALQMSLNIPAIAVLDKVDPHRLAGRLQRAGAAPRFPKGAKPGLAMGLGGVGLSLEELVHLYGAIARGGTALDMHIQSESVSSSSRSRVLSAAASSLLTKAMQQKSDRYHAHRGNLIYKTGTSYGYRDAWTIGFDGQHVVGVWVGRPDNAPAGHITGATAALPIFLDVFARMGTQPHPDLDGAVLVSNAELPEHLKVFGKKSSNLNAAGTSPVIAFPRGGSEVPIQDASSIALKVRGGSAPFTWLADGRPVTMKALRRESLYHPEGPGFSTLTVIDAKGRTDQVSIRLTN